MIQSIEPEDYMIGTQTNENNNKGEKVSTDKTFWHPASYKGCPIYKALLHKLNLKKDELLEKKQNNQSNNK